MNIMQKLQQSVKNCNITFDSSEIIFFYGSIKQSKVKRFKVVSILYFYTFLNYLCYFTAMHAVLAREKLVLLRPNSSGVHFSGY